jgi:hypothetical protein
MLNPYDQQRIENAQAALLRSLEGIRDSLKDMNQMVGPLRNLAHAPAILKNQSHGVATVPPGSIRGYASADNRGGR